MVRNAFSNALRATLCVSLLQATLARGATTPAIYSSVYNTSTKQLTITGTGFSPTGLAPQVTFANTALTILSFSNTATVAQVPTG